VTVIDALIVGLVATLVVAGLPAVGAVLVTALVVIPPVAARFWTERAGVMLALAGLIGLVSALVGVAVSASRPGLATGPLVVLAAAAWFAGSFLLAPGRGWIARHREAVSAIRSWDKGLALDVCLQLADSRGQAGDAMAPCRQFTASEVLVAVAGDRVTGRRDAARAWASIVHAGLVEPADAGRWRLSVTGEAAARARRKTVGEWLKLFDQDPDAARALATIAPDGIRAESMGSRA